MQVHTEMLSRSTFYLKKYPGLINIQDAFGSSPLILASANGHYGVVSALFDHSDKYLTGEIYLEDDKYDEISVDSIHYPQSLDVDIFDERGRNGLMYASANGHHQIVELFMKRSGTGLPSIINAKDNTKMTALHWAAKNGHAEVVKVLQQPREMDSFLLALDIIIMKRLSPSLEKVREEKAQERIVDVNSQDKDGNTPLLWAVLENHAEVVKVLLDNNSNARLNNIFSNKDNEEITTHVTESLLRTPPVDTNLGNKYGMTPLMMAVGLVGVGYYDVAKQLIDHLNTNVNVQKSKGDGMSPLIFAIRMGHANIIHLLLNREDIDVNLVDKEGYTALHWAAVLADHKTVKLLLDEHDVDISDIDLDKIQHRDIEIFLDKHEYFDNFYKDITTAWSEKIINPYTIMVWANKFLSDNRYYDSDIYDLSL